MSPCVVVFERDPSRAFARCGAACWPGATGRCVAGSALAPWVVRAAAFSGALAEYGRGRGAHGIVQRRAVLYRPEAGWTLGASLEASAAAVPGAGCHPPSGGAHGAKAGSGVPEGAAIDCLHHRDLCVATAWGGATRCHAAGLRSPLLPLRASAVRCLAMAKTTTAKTKMESAAVIGLSAMACAGARRTSRERGRVPLIDKSRRGGALACKTGTWRFSC